MREVGAARIEQFRVSHGSLYGGVGGMRLVSQRIEKQDVEAAQLLERLGRNLAVIGKVGGRSKAIPVDYAAPVQQPERADFEAIQVERRSIEYVGFQIRNRGLRQVFVENVAKRVANGVQGLFRSEDRDGALLPEVERAHVV